jgi:hypothetical protein
MDIEQREFYISHTNLFTFTRCVVVSTVLLLSLRSSRTLRSVAGWGFVTFQKNTVPSSPGIKMKALCSIETSGIPDPATHRYIPEDLNPKVYTSWTTLKMEETSLLETFMFIYHSTQGHIPEDLNLQCSVPFGLKTPVTFTAIAMSVHHTVLSQVTALFQMLRA